MRKRGCGRTVFSVGKLQTAWGVSIINYHTFARTTLGAGVLALGIFAFAGCQRSAPTPPAPPPPGVTVARPVTYPVQSYYDYNGHLEAVETVEIRARVKGLLEEVHFKEGDEVKQDAQLYTIDAREYRTAQARATADVARAAAEIDNWRAQIKLAETELARVTGLPAGAVTQSEIDKARATVDVNKAQFAVAQAMKDSAAASLRTATIQLSYTDIRAPIAGRISRTLVTKGNLVGQDQTTLLTTIVSVDPVFVYFDAPERDLRRYQQTASGKNGEAAVLVGVTNEIGYPHRGTIDFRENRVDPGTGTIRLRGRIPNPMMTEAANRPLYPGFYARVRVPSGDPVPRPVIPEDALLTGQEGRFVYVVGAGEVIEKRVVTVGSRVFQAVPPGEAGPPAWALVNPNPPPPKEGAKPAPLRLPIRSAIAIEKGLTADDRVVIIGLQRARPGAPVAPELWEIRVPKHDDAGK
jgi:RND family efflux transporter MFP subunit